MELFVLGLVLGVGAAKRKAVTKAVAKSYMAVTDKTKTVTSALREDMRDAVEEARSEADRDIPDLDHNPAIAEGQYDAEYIALHEETTSAPLTVGNGAGEGEQGAEAKPKGSLFKSLAKGYVAVTERTRSAAAGLREEMRDAIEEARYEREQAALRAREMTAEPASAETEAPADEAPAEVVAAATVTAKAAPVKTEAEPKTKRKYTKRPKEEAVAPEPAPQQARGRKATGQAANGAAPAQGGRRKAAPQERPNREMAGEALLEAVEVAAELAI